MLGIAAMVYRALAPMPPPVIDAMELWQVGTLFDEDIAPARPTLVIPDHLAAPRKPGGVILREVDY